MPTKCEHGTRSDSACKQCQATISKIELEAYYQSLGTSLGGD